MVDSEQKDERKWADDLWKKFFRAGSIGGFVAMRPWFEAGKLSIDVGETSSDNTLVNNTQVWAPIIPFATYVRALSTNTASFLYGADEEYLHYGGGNTSEGPISRILKVSHWYNDDSHRSFEIKTGHFKAKESNTGAFVPDMSQSVSQNKIKVTRAELAEVSYLLEVAISNFARNEDWLSHINGKVRG